MNNEVLRRVTFAIEQAGTDPEAKARAAIEALRNPTDEMVEVCQDALVNTMRNLGWSKAQRQARLSVQTKTVMRWNAMLDWILK